MILIQGHDTKNSVKINISPPICSLNLIKLKQAILGFIERNNLKSLQNP